MTGATTDPATLAARVDALLADLRGQDPRASRMAEDLVRTLMRFYGAALERMLDAVAEAGGDAASAVFERWAGDPAVASVLLVHDLHPDDMSRRVERALGSVERALAAEQASVVVTEISPQVVRIRLTGPRAVSSHCRQLVERTVARAVPDADRVEIDAPQVVATIPLLRADGSACDRPQARHER